jgi:glycosyltransferase involved in cell wall biosynthesis
VAKLRNINLYCVDTIGGGGTEVWVQSLIKSLANNYNVRLISGTLNPDSSQFVSKFVKLRLPPKPAFFRVLMYSILSSFVPKSNAEVSHVVGAITFRKSNLNTIHFYHKENFRLRRSTIYGNNSKIRVLNRILYTLICICMEKIIYTKWFSQKLASVSPEMCTLLEKDFGRSIYLTHNGISPLEIQKVQFAIPYPHLLFVGGDWERKGLADVIESVSIVKHLHPSIKLYVAGSGNRKPYDESAKKLRIEDNIVWMGRVPRTEIPYSDKSILLSASSFEVSPLVFLEAAISGAPVISYPVFGTAEAIEDGYLRICEPSPSGIAREVITLLSDAQEMTRMSTMGMRLRETKNWDLMVRETLDLYPE